MLSAIISTRESERTLVPTLAALVPAATTGFLRDVIVADAGSKDATEEVADIAGCRFLSSAAPTGQRLTEAAREAKGRWLMFLRAGAVPDAAWPAVVEQFVTQPENSKRAAAFSGGGSSLAAALRATFGHPTPDQGLLIARSLYDQIGGHSPGHDAETDLLRRLRRLTHRLGATITVRNS
jgi:hypothetical protein